MFGIHITQDTCKQLGVKTYAQAMNKFHDAGLKTCQIFVANPRTGRLMDINGPFPIKTHVHSSYLCHMCNPNGPHFIHQELAHANTLGCASLVVHLEKKTMEENVIAAQRLLRWRLDKHIETEIYFENNAVKSSAETSYERAERLNEFIRKVGMPGFKLCIDTSHLWVGGINMADPAVVQQWFDTISRGHIGLFHLNDNVNAIGGHDVHSPLGQGKIWQHDKTAIGVVLRYAHDNNIDIILERGGDLNKFEFDLIAEFKKKF